MLRIVVAGLGLLGLGSSVADTPAMPDWMAGCWEQKTGDKWTEECWMPPRGGVMLGSGRSGRGDKVREWEATQIILEQPDGDHPAARMAYWGAPGGVGRTAFTWTADGQPGVTFINTEHDYPQRIHYWREGAELMAEVSMADGSKPMRWRYKSAN